MCDCCNASGLPRPVPDCQTSTTNAQFRLNERDPDEWVSVIRSALTMTWKEHRSND